MKKFTRHHIAIVLAAFIVTTSDAAAKPIEERNWIQMESAHFTIHSALNKAQTTNLLKYLEVIHSLFLGIADESTQSTVPTVIFAFDSKEDFAGFRDISDDTIGFFRTGIRRNELVISEVRGMDESSIIVHEYVHYLLRNQSRFPFPKWYEEGYAQYLGHSSLKKPYFDVGKADRGRIRWLKQQQWLPMERLLDSASYGTLDEDERSLFYAQSWLFVHYLYNQPGGERYVVNALRTYARGILQSMQPIPAFEAAFDMTVNEAEDVLKTYAKRRKFGYARFPLQPLLQDFSPTLRKMSKEEVCLELAYLFLSADASEKVAMCFKMALADPSTLARAEMGLGKLLEANHDFAAAEDYINSAVSLASDDVEIQLDAADYWLNRYAASGRTQYEYAELAKAPLMRAFKLDQSRPEVLLLTGIYLYDTNEDRTKAVQYLEAAAARAPADQGSRLILARIFLNERRFEEAIRYAQNVIDYSHGENSLTIAARRIIARAEQQ